MTAGIYRIRNRATGEAYIGSSFDIFTRIRRHISSLSRGNHENKRLTADWGLLGRRGFAFSILEVTEATDAELMAAEEKWMQIIRTYTGAVYNRRSAAIGRRYGTQSAILIERNAKRRAQQGAADGA